MKKKLSSFERQKLRMRNERLLISFRNMVINHRNGYNQDFVNPEKTPIGKLVRFARGFRDGRDSGRVEIKPVIVWRYP